MSSPHNLQQDATEKEVEMQKIRQLLSKNIEDFKSLALYNMRLEEKFKSSNESLHLNVNRLNDFQQRSTEKTESLEEWVAREFAPKEDAKKNSRKSSFVPEIPGETLEEWVARQPKAPKKTKTSNPTLIDAIEQWLMDEAKKDLFAQMDEQFNSEELSSAHVRELGLTLIALADKLDKMKSM